MLAATLKWRDERDVSAALKHNLADDVLVRLTAYDRCFLAGFAKGGYPVFYEPVNAAQINVLARVVAAEDCMWASIQSMEWMCRVLMPLASRRSGRPVEKFMHVLDCSPLSLSDISGPALHVFKSWAAISKAHYPELVRRIYIINSPRSMRAILSLINPLIPTATRSKIVVLGSGMHAHTMLKEELGPECKIPVSAFTGSAGSWPDGAVSVLRCVVEYIADQQTDEVGATTVRRTHTVLTWPQIGSQADNLERKPTFVRVAADAVPINHGAFGQAHRTLSSATAYHDCDGGISDLDLEDAADERNVWYASRALAWSKNLADDDAAPSRKLRFCCC